MTEIQQFNELRNRIRRENANWIKQCAEVGDFTYAANPTIRSWGEGSKLYIGKFCSIGANVKFLLGGNHHTEWCSTYPFNVLLSDLCPNSERCAATKGNIVIGNDVWIANDVTILSGVTIGDGAVIANGAIVTKDILAFEVVGGIPAKKIKDRFDAYTMLKFSQIKWWDWSDEKLVKALPLLCSEDYIKLIEFDKANN